MKKVFALLSCFILFTAITCENEPIDEGVEAVEPNLSCEQASLNTADAALNFINGIEDGNYEALCNAYKDALEAQIEACGDPDGAIQQGIDALGNCTDPNNFDDCEAAEEAASLAEINFNNASSDTYTDFCNSYKLALENQIEECGDDGTIQTIIDELGDCSNDNQPNSDGLITLSAGSAPITFDLITVVEEGNILKVSGASSANGASNYAIYFEVTQNETGIDIINSTFELTLISTFFPNTDGFDDFTSNIMTNTADTIEGTFSGIVTNADGGDLSLTSGQIDISY